MIKTNRMLLQYSASFSTLNHHCGGIVIKTKKSKKSVDACLTFTKQETLKLKAKDLLE